MTTSFIFQTFFWNDVVRAAVILAGGASFARSGIVVTVGFQLTPFPLSASVSCFHSDPPHFEPGALEATRFAGRAAAALPPALPADCAAAPACAAIPATSAAAAAARTTFMFP